MINVSVIIPVYNAEQYLEQCIGSVLAQSEKEIEIICVNDGSTDQSVQIIQQFISLDARIILLQQKNCGPGEARNLALKRARGKYIAFLDADDYYLDKHALELMVDVCEKKHMFVCASLRKVIANGVEKETAIQGMKKNIILDYQNYQMDYDYQSYLFQKDFLLKNNFYFPNYRRFEDPVFLTKVLFSAKNFIVADTYLYCYRSPVMAARFDTKNIIDLLKGILDNLIFAVNHELNILFANTVFRLEYEYYGIIIHNISATNLQMIELLIQANQLIREQNKNPDYILRPLGRLLVNMYQHEKDLLKEYEKDLLKRIEQQNKIILYGAGWFGKLFLSYLKNHHLSEKVLFFVVSDLKGNTLQIDGIPVVTLQDLNQQEKPLILVTVGEKISREVENYLKENRYEKYEVIEEPFLLQYCR